MTQGGRRKQYFDTWHIKPTCSCTTTCDHHNDDDDDDDDDDDGGDDGDDDDDRNHENDNVASYKKCTVRPILHPTSSEINLRCIKLIPSVPQKLLTCTGLYQFCS